MRLPAASSLLSRVRIFDRVLTAQSSAALAGEDEGTYYRTPSSYDAVELHMEACVWPHPTYVACPAWPRHQARRSRSASASSWSSPSFVQPNSPSG